MIAHLPHPDQQKSSRSTNGKTFYRTFCSPDGSQIALKATLYKNFLIGARLQQVSVFQRMIACSFFSDMEGIISIYDRQAETLLVQFNAVQSIDEHYDPYESWISDMLWLPQSDLLATAGYKTTDPSGILTITLWRLA